MGKPAWPGPESTGLWEALKVAKRTQCGLCALPSCQEEMRKLLKVPRCQTLTGGTSSISHRSYGEREDAFYKVSYRSARRDVGLQN